MTVAELQAELAKWPPDLVVYALGRLGPVEEVERFPEGLVIS